MTRSLAALVLLASLASAQSVYIVDQAAGPGAFSTEIQPAIDAAANLDIVLVRNGADYVPFTLFGKSLTIIAEAGAHPRVWPSRISGLHSYDRVVVSGIEFFHLTLSDCAGPVWLEGCSTVPSLIWAPGMEAPLGVTNCASVALRDCAIHSWNGYSFPTGALSATNSNVSAWDSSFYGGNGPDFDFYAPAGSPAAHVIGGSLFVSGCVFRGGDGGTYYGPPGTNVHGTNGGDGIVASVQVVILDSLISGGSGSVAPGGNGSPGSPIVGTAPMLLGAFARSFSVTSPVRESHVATFSLGGAPGEWAGIFYSFAPCAFFPMLTFGGVDVVELAGASSLLLVNGTVGVPIGNLPTSVGGVTFFAQSVFFDPALTHVEIGPPASLIILDASL